LVRNPEASEPFKNTGVSGRILLKLKLKRR
jgi:hypothetical protein